MNLVPTPTMSCASPGLNPQTRLGDLLQKYLRFFSEKTILVLGDVMLDRYISGEVKRISPEAPIPVLKKREERAVLGGAGNVASNIAALGARSILVGLVGDDTAGGEIRELLKTGQVCIVDCLCVVQGRGTTVKTRFTSGGHQLLRLDDEDTAEIGSSLTTLVVNEFERVLPEADAVVLSDYAKGLLTKQLLGHVISLARASRKPIIADPKRLSFADYSQVDVLTPNVLEISQATGIAASDDQGAESAGQVALAQSSSGAVLVTRSEKGLTLVRPGLPAQHLPTHARQVADVSGAGDTLVAALSVMLACKAELVEAAVVANVAAGLSVAKFGTATISQSELATAVYRRDKLTIDSKIKLIGDDLSEVFAWRDKGSTIGIASGNFDLTDSRQIRLLNHAHSLCDRLIVALWTDLQSEPSSSTKTASSQAMVLAFTAAVDLVVVVSSVTIQVLIDLVRPNFYFVNRSLLLDFVQEMDLARRLGGEVVIIDAEALHRSSNGAQSSTNVIPEVTL